jgi:hypothetical protein
MMAIQKVDTRLRGDGGRSFIGDGPLHLSGTGERDLMAYIVVSETTSHGEKSIQLRGVLDTAAPSIARV